MGRGYGAVLLLSVVGQLVVLALADGGDSLGQEKTYYSPPSPPSPVYEPAPVVAAPAPVAAPTYTPQPTYTPAPASSPTPGTCEYWSLSSVTFPDVLSVLATVVDLFGGTSGSIFGTATTLLQGLTNTIPGGYGSLLRQGSAALLNSYSDPRFLYTPQAVKESFGAALVSEPAAAFQGLQFEIANHGYHRN